MLTTEGVQEFNSFFKLPLEKQREVIKDLKQYSKNRDKFYMSKGADVFKEHAKSIKSNNQWTKDKTMKHAYSIPAEVYWSNPDYWKSIIEKKEYWKHPEWIVGSGKEKSHF